VRGIAAGPGREWRPDHARRRCRPDAGRAETRDAIDAAAAAFAQVAAESGVSNAAVAHLWRANVRVLQGQNDKARAGYQAGIRLKPDLAALHAAGALSTGEPLVHESIIGSRFVGSVVSITSIADHPAVITEVEGSAWLCGYNTFVLDPDDPLGTGFVLR